MFGMQQTEATGFLKWCGRKIYEQFSESISQKDKDLTDTKKLPERTVRSVPLTFWTYVANQKRMRLCFIIITALTGIGIILTLGLSVHMYLGYIEEKNKWERQTGFLREYGVYSKRGIRY